MVGERAQHVRIARLVAVTDGDEDAAAAGLDHAKPRLPYGELGAVRPVRLGEVAVVPFELDEQPLTVTVSTLPAPLLNRVSPLTVLTRSGAV